ncbi:flagellar export chaperone FliS [Pseudidiomarina sp.]|mgnify:CR=1 FL=1|jgi:flagellar protein FliS|uniref:flagellar export chaperone FliS n=1 Tax=Pseudidiomarina sp. TaxID=2081707 RepID=UPI003A975965
MKGINEYKTVGAESASPHKLIQMLFDTYLVRVDQAITAIQAKDMNAKGIATSKALAIVGGLEEGLDLEKGGELAENLQALYRYVRQRLLVATDKNDIEALKEARELIFQIKDAWDQIPTEFHFHQG